MFLTLGLYVMPPDEVEVEPSFVVAVLICPAQNQGFMKNGERSTMKPNFPWPIRFRRFRNPQTSAHTPAAMFGVMINTRVRNTGNQATGPRKDNASTIVVISAELFE